MLQAGRAGLGPPAPEGARGVPWPGSPTLCADWAVALVLCPACRQLWRWGPARLPLSLAPPHLGLPLVPTGAHLRLRGWSLASLRPRGRVAWHAERRAQGGPGSCLLCVAREALVSPLWPKMRQLPPTCRSCCLVILSHFCPEKEGCWLHPCFTRPCLSLPLPFQIYK